MAILQELFEYLYNKPMEIDKILQIVDDIVISNMAFEPKAEEILGIDSLEPDGLRHHLYAMNEQAVHNALRKLSRLMRQ